MIVEFTRPTTGPPSLNANRCVRTFKGCRGPHIKLSSKRQGEIMMSKLTFSRAVGSLTVLCFSVFGLAAPYPAQAGPR